MSFSESPRFPEVVSFWMKGGPMFNTTIVVVNSGEESRNINWGYGLASYDIQDGLRKVADIAATLSFFRSMKGRGHGFRVKDFSDFSAGTAGVLGVSGLGAGVPAYQMYKNYASGALTDQRKIRKPVAGTIIASRGGVPVTVGAGAGQVAIDTTTGVVTFVADTSSSASSITVGATTQVALAANLGAVAGNIIYLSGFTGADSALVNGLGHTINSIAGVGPYTFTLATNTAGKTITLGTGLGRKFPQSADILTWTGEFDVPCRFDSDLLSSMGMDGSGALYTIGSVTLVELRRPS